MKIAVTSTDGVNVDQHFGKADSFLIYELTCSSIKEIEKRSVEPYCSSAKSTDPNHKFEVDKISVIYEQLKDCDTLYTKQIGEKPEEGLKELGLNVKLCSCPIESIAGCSGECK